MYVLFDCYGGCRSASCLSSSLSDNAKVIRRLGSTAMSTESLRAIYYTLLQQLICCHFSVENEQFDLQTCISQEARMHQVGQVVHTY